MPACDGPGCSVPPPAEQPSPPTSIRQVVDHVIKQKGMAPMMHGVGKLYVPSVIETTDIVPSKANRKQGLVRTNLRPKR